MAGTGGDGRARVQHAHPTRRPKPCGPDAPAVRYGDVVAGGGVEPLPSAARKDPIAVEQAFVAGDSAPMRSTDERFKKSVHRGPHGASLKHRARDAGEFGDLR
jgi:hypothetical protein